MSTVRLFVYGSLLPGQEGYPLVEPFLLSREPGMVRGKLYAAEYARYVPGGDDMVRGEWYTLDPRVLPILDDYEDYHGPGHPDNEYERVAVADAATGAVGWVYARPAAGPEDRLVESGNWLKQDRIP